jgi:hypothetical protein
VPHDAKRREADFDSQTFVFEKLAKELDLWTGGIPKKKGGK